MRVGVAGGGLGRKVVGREEWGEMVVHRVGWCGREEVRDEER